MRLSETSEETDRFLRIPAKFQKTFLTPIKDLHRFVATILSPFRLEHGRVTIEQVIFPPTNLLALLASHSIHTQHCNDITVTAFGQSEIAALLEAALGDWLDFLFVPTPKSFAIYVGHDEHITFFADSHSELLLVTTGLDSKGFTAAPDYIREP